MTVSERCFRGQFIGRPVLLCPKGAAADPVSTGTGTGARCHISYDGKTILCGAHSREKCRFVKDGGKTESWPDIIDKLLCPVCVKLIREIQPGILSPMPLTPAERRILQALTLEIGDGNNETDEVDLVWEKGAGWWLGADRVSAKTCRGLIRKILIGEESDSRTGEFERYHINESGRKALKGEYPVYTF